MLLSEQKKGNMSKAKTLIEKVGTRYLEQVPWSPQQTIPDHRSKNSSAEHIHALQHGSSSQTHSLT